jgi:hypothetical protein
MTIVRLEGLRQLKNPMTSSGIETATFRLVAYCLNRLRYRVPLNNPPIQRYVSLDTESVLTDHKKKNAKAHDVP